jgi:hypothetical protein
MTHSQRGIDDPIRPLHQALYDIVRAAVGDRFMVTHEATTADYAGGRIEIAGRTFLFLVVPEESTFAVLHRKDKCSCVVPVDFAGDSAARGSAGEEQGAPSQISTKGDR